MTWDALFSLSLRSLQKTIQMRKPSFILFLLVLLTACAGPKTDAPAAAEAVAADSVVADAAQPAPLEADSLLNTVARFYAGISAEGISLTERQQAAWSRYARRMQSYVTSSRKTTDPMDTLMSHDMADLRRQCDYVFYPFSGPDFLYPITLFPEASTIFMAGLEPTGSPLTAIAPDSLHFRSYTKSLQVFMHCSFFRTKSMDKDFDSEEIDGTVPVISMLMALRGYQIVSVGYKTLTSDGAMADTLGVSPLAEIRFFHPATPLRLQTLYYLSGDLSDRRFDERVGRYLDATLPQHRVVTFLKAASYLLHQPSFKTMRSQILRHTAALIGDDSGMPYRYLKDDFDVTLYGHYQRPIRLFGDHDYQRDLQALYDSTEVRPLPFRIGYNNTSNWMVARRKS